MDSEHRHELEENALAKWLEPRVKQLQPHLPAILLGAFAFAGAVVGYNFWQSSTAASEAQAWEKFNLAVEGVTPSIDVLRVAADENSGNLVGEWAEITWADGRLNQSSVFFLSDKTKSTEALDDAEAAYKELTSSTVPGIADRARLGLARVAESRGDYEAAAKEYERVRGPFAEIAKERSEALADEQTVEKIEWITSAAGEGVTPDNSAEEAATDESEMSTSEMLDDLLSDSEAEAATDEAADGAEEPAAEATDEPADK